MELVLKGKVGLISGSYRGTGAGTAKVFGEEGALVGVHGHELGQADEVVAGITANKGTAVAVHGELGPPQGADDIVSQIEAA